MYGTRINYYKTNATSEQIQAGTMFARACEVCILPKKFNNCLYKHLFRTTSFVFFL